ncbi:MULTISPECIES: LLM class F420-dependent oxidoreductase [unclassified Actinopolyspora]|uniref:LLM class F420-dependent oxidoreductase n=1 Tax=unclassified Actinopolyspora TaxID=2639451 RepID=UPI0013F651F5|nr:MULTISPECIES: LLM class F420-dependent oxidoreductase [unclassified Actinopolyspora]NHD15709.1 LLM class F420-dependent oxidoreductase [Actinopolyspora sp. BKK2]NHE75077.1 LLM class F420-dependent oxidoreductase [Actinopolyspora sp. BKK1]
MSRIDFASRVGVWWTSDQWSINDVIGRAREIEQLGYGSLFYGEAGGKETFTQAAALLSGTERLVVGTGIANIHARSAPASESGARTLTAQHPGRFVLGLGVSHAPLVERSYAGSYSRPLSTMRDYLQTMDAVPAEVEPGAQRPTRLLAALGPKMIELSGTAADGAHPYLVTPEHTASTREQLGPDKWVVSEQAVALTTDRQEGVRRGHQHLHMYSQLPNYQNSWLRQGFDESDLVVGGSDRLAEGMVAMGDAETVAAQVTRHLDAGADHVVIQVLGEDPAADPLPALRELAPALGLG